MADLPELLWDVINAAAARDWERVENKAEDLKVWARAAKKVLTDPSANEHPGNGPGKGR